MTKVVLEINCGDPNASVLAENLPFLENISGLPFSLKFSWFLKFLLAEEKQCFLCLTSFSCFSVISQPFFPFGILA